MTERIDNSGIVTLGGTTNLIGPTAVGDGATINITGESARKATSPEGGAGTDVGVITIVTEEAQAVRRVLGLKPDRRNGLSFDLGTVDAGRRALTIAALQTLSQGEGSIASAFSHLRETFNPEVMVLTDIAGSINPDVHLGDVVIATRVICYDLRKETSERIIRRGQERQAPAGIGHAVNRFFADYGEPGIITSQVPGTAPGVIRVLKGPVGSGNAVIAHRDSEIVSYLLAFNDKILAIDMESDGFSQAFHDRPRAERPSGWLVIRGISDHADEQKNDDYHHIAACNAAAVLHELLPYLPSSQA